MIEVCLDGDALSFEPRCVQRRTDEVDHLAVADEMEVQPGQPLQERRDGIGQASAQALPRRTGSCERVVERKVGVLFAQRVYLVAQADIFFFPHTKDSIQLGLIGLRV